jgi:uncharacterized lipoprotein YmbA
MNTQRSARTFLAALCIALVSGCATPAAEHFYTVSTARSTSLAGTEPPRIALAPIAIPAILDRPQLVVRTSGHELQVLENHRWAEPLALDLTRALVDELNRAPTGIQVVEATAAQARATPLVLEVTISELAVGPGQSVSLQATWVLRDRQRTCIRIGRIAVEIPTQDGYSAIPTAYASAMARLAGPIAQTIEQDSSCGLSADARERELDASVDRAGRRRAARGARTEVD